MKSWKNGYRWVILALSLLCNHERFFIQKFSLKFFSEKQDNLNHPVISCDKRKRYHGYQLMPTRSISLNHMILDLKQKCRDLKDINNTFIGTRRKEHLPPISVSSTNQLYSLTISFQQLRGLHLRERAAIFLLLPPFIGGKSQYKEHVPQQVFASQSAVCSSRQ